MGGSLPERAATFRTSDDSDASRLQREAANQQGKHATSAPRGQRVEAGPVSAELEPARERRRTKEADLSEERRTRRARLRVSRIDPWSVMKTSFLFSIAGGIILFVAVWAMWTVIQKSGVLVSLEDTINGLIVAPGSDQQFHFNDYVDQFKILGFTAILAAADVVILTALATLFAFLYNLSAQVLGGLEVTLSED